jgi:predicted secreted protein with PEFG-CTERM motif
MQDQKTWDLYNKSKQCMDLLGVNSDSVAPLSYKVNQALMIPEFGPVAGMIIAISIASIIIISRKIRFYF